MAVVAVLAEMAAVATVALFMMYQHCVQQLFQVITALINFMKILREEITRKAVSCSGIWRSAERADTGWHWLTVADTGRHRPALAGMG